MILGHTSSETTEIYTNVFRSRKKTQIQNKQQRKKTHA